MKHVSNFAELLEQASYYVSEGLRLPAEAKEICDLIAVWCAGSYFIKYCYAYPYLTFIVSERIRQEVPLIDTISPLTNNPYTIFKPTAAILYRVFEGKDNNNMTLIIDGLDRVFRRENQVSRDVHAILNAAYRRGIEVWRVDRKTNGVKSFKIFSAKVLISRQPLPPSVMDRSIVIDLTKLCREEVERFQPRKDTCTTDGVGVFHTIAKKFADESEIVELFRKKSKGEIRFLLEGMEIQPQLWEGCKNLFLLAYAVDKESQEWVKRIARGLWLCVDKGEDKPPPEWDEVKVVISYKQKPPKRYAKLRDILRLS